MRKRLRFDIPATELTPPIIVSPYSARPRRPLDRTGPKGWSPPCTPIGGSSLTLPQQTPTTPAHSRQNSIALRSHLLARLRLRLSVPPGHPYATPSRPQVGRGACHSNPQDLV
jgi:hypothetical protein